MVAALIRLPPNGLTVVRAAVRTAFTLPLQLPNGSEIGEVARRADSASMTTPVLELANVVVDFGHGPALDGITAEIPRGAVFGVLGPSGSGKTTLARVISGEVIPRSGRVRINGRRPSPWAGDFRREVGIVRRASMTTSRT